MNKPIFSIIKIGNYFREISVVVIGVAITLSVNVWINHKNEKKDIALYLNAIKLELETNIEMIDSEVEYLQDWENYSLYLLSHDKKSINPDSIRWGGDGSGLGTVKDIIFQTSAFEMLKNSGAMRLIEDKELLQSIWNSYLHLESIRMSINSYYELKKEQSIKENQLVLEGKPPLIPLYDFFVTYINFGALEGCKRISVELKEMISKLEKSKMIKQ